MAKIPLRAYNREIEKLIDQNQLEQAIAHARHILNYFPKHVNSYRLLGKAYLESQRYGDAADVFQRVLSSIPDDFISHVGMSIIREDEANLDHAIWHMERAFEVQPANGAIQGELRRLYGRRDGMEPPKVRLTRSALARMYIKGELFQQAISEVRAALAEDPQRPDLLSLLAQAYFQNGQRVEAANTCSSLLNKFPYSLEANRILAEILSSTERAEEAQVYRQRVQALEPYFGHTSPASPTPDLVSETAVVLEKLVWSPGQSVTGAQKQPEWAASLGVELEATAPAEEGPPEWLADQPEAEPSATPEAHEEGDEAPSETPTPPSETPFAELPEDAIPDWMKEAGWQSASGDVEEPVDILEGPAQDELTPAQIPDWLQSIAPGEKPEAEISDETGESMPPIEETLSDSDALSWLDDAPPGPSDTVASWLDENQPAVPDISETESETEEKTEVPAWLKDLQQPEPPSVSDETLTGTLTSPDEVSELEPQAQSLLPEIEAESDFAPSTTEADEGEKIPDWLQELGGAPSVEEEIEPTEELPDWLRQSDQEEWQTSEPSETATPETLSMPPVEELPISSEDDELAWLDDLADKQGKKESIPLIPEDALAEAPDWVLEAALETPEILPTAEDAPTSPLSELPTEVADQDTEDLQLPDQVEPIEIPDWLREMSPEPTAEASDQTESDLGGALFEFEEEKAEITEPTEWISGLETPEKIDLETSMLFSPQEIATEPEAELTLEEISEGEPESFDISDTQPTRIQLQQEEAEILSEESAIPALDTLDTEIPEWLRGVGEEQMAAKEMPSEPPAEELPAEITDFEQALEQVAAEEALSESPVEELPAEITDFEQVLEPSAAAEMTPDISPESGVPLDDEDAFAWLESLAARQGAQEALLLEPEDRLEAPPDWVQKAAEEEQLAGGQPGLSETSPSLEDVSEEEPLPDAQFEEATTTETSAPESLPIMEEILDEAVSPPVTAQEEPIIESLEPMPEEAESLEARPDLPSWLTDVEMTKTPEAEAGWAPPVEKQPESVIEEETPVFAEQSAETLPETVNLNEAGQAELEQLPGVGFTRAQAIINYRQEHGPFSNVEELINVYGFGEVLVNSLIDKIKVVEAQPAEVLPEAVGDNQVILIQARNALIQGNISEALVHYTHLVKEQQFLPEVIQDLNEALYRFPVDVSIWEALGEAHLRAGRLQEALDALTKAEELIR